MNQKSKWLLLSLAGIAVVAAVAGILFFSHTDETHSGMSDNRASSEPVEESGVLIDAPIEAEEDAYGNTPGNLANMGLVAESDGLIYYSAGFDGLFKARPDGSERIKLADGFCININVMDDWVYYEDSNNYNLCKVRVDGTGFTKLLDDANNIIVENGSIYYTDWYIYKIHMDGTGANQVSSNKAHVMTIANGWIYYVNEDDGYSLYKIRVDGTDEKKLRSGPAQLIIIEGDWIYFEGVANSDNKLYRMRTDGTSEIELSDEADGHFNVSNGWIYYRNKNDSCLHRMRTDGTGDVTLTEIIRTNYNIAGEWLYYYNIDENLTLCRVKLDGTENQPVE